MFWEKNLFLIKVLSAYRTLREEVFTIENFTAWGILSTPFPLTPIPPVSSRTSLLCRQQQQEEQKIETFQGHLPFIYSPSSRTHLQLIQSPLKIALNYNKRYSKGAIS